MILPWVEAIADGATEARIPAGRYTSPRVAASAAHQAAGHLGLKISTRVRDDGSVTVLPRCPRPVRQGEAYELFGPLLGGEKVRVPSGRYRNSHTAASAAHRFAHRHRIAVKTMRHRDGSVTVRRITVRSVKRTIRKRTQDGSRRATRVAKVTGPAAPVVFATEFDAEADRLDELADLSYIAIAHKWGMP